jgi:ribosomal protein S18 acetylase RimI-like enzyme
MGLLPEARGQRVGERLLRACLDKARAKGLTRIELHVRADNSRAIALYRRLGFAPEAVLARGMRFDGVYYDGLQMSLLLD